ncbi:MAG: helicase-associated domain-containing protein [Mycobacteriales bacterium]
MESPRSLADWLRAHSDDDLRELLAARPDLVAPVPPDIGLLASRACTRMSVLRALERLDQFGLEIVDALALLDTPTTEAELLALVGAGAPAADVRRAVARLRGLALVWGDDELHLVAAVREVGSAYPAGLGRPVAACLGRHAGAALQPILDALGLAPARDQRSAVAAVAELFADPARLGALLAQAGAGGAEVLRQLAVGPPLGQVSDALRPVRAADADSPVRWLLAHALLVAVDVSTVELPREVGLALRGDAPLGPLHPVSPELRTTTVGARGVDSTAALQAAGAVNAVESLLEAWGVEPPPVLRAGGLGVRELRRLAKDLDRPEPVAALLVEVAHGAGLVDVTTGLDPMWVPTTAYDAWRNQPPEQRWMLLARAWLELTRLPRLVGERDERDRVLAPLGPDLERASAPAQRRAVLEALAALPAGVAADPAALAEWLGWQAPRRGGRLRDRLVAWTMAEADALGITGRDGLANPARALLAGDPARAAAALRPLLPEPLDYVLLQADLTAVAPGPLRPDLARELGLVADVESSGGATVYRITDSSVRRALDAGRGAADLQAFFAAISRTPVPQALDYLVGDVARRHGVLRVGSASSYLRCDDESLLAELMAVRKVAPLGLRRLAPTVLTAHAPVERVLGVLREAGYAPVAESADGAVVISRPDSRRTPALRRPARRGEPPVPTAEQLARLVAELRSGDDAARAARRMPVTRSLAGAETGATSTTLALLQEAAREHRSIWLGYVNAEGSATDRIVEPVSVDGGYLTAFDQRREHTLTFALHRVTGVVPLTDEPPQRTTS